MPILFSLIVLKVKTDLFHLPDTVQRMMCIKDRINLIYYIATAKLTETNAFVNQNDKTQLQNILKFLKS